MIHNDNRALINQREVRIDTADFRVAMSVQFVFWALGAFQVWRYRRKGLAHIDAHPGAMAALRRGETLLPGLSRDPD